MSKRILLCVGIVLAGAWAARGQDAEVRLVAVETPTLGATTTVLPTSISLVAVGDTYHVEVWASDTGLGVGLSSVYVDVLWPELLAEAVSIDHGSVYTVFRSGDIGPGMLDELGGSTVREIGIAPEWVKVATVEMTATAAGEAIYTMVPSHLGIAARGIGAVPWSRVTLVPVSVIHRCFSDEGCNDGNPCTIDTCFDGGCLFTPSEFDPPFIVHGDGLKGQTRPYTGYVDPRGESTNGLTLDRGLTEMTIVFNEVVRGLGGTPLTPDAFDVTVTGGSAPRIADVDDSENPVVKITFSTPPPVREWTTVRAAVEDLCGNPIQTEGNLGPGVAEPDRVDFLFLPGDIDQNGGVQPLDLLRFRQIIQGVFLPSQGIDLDFVDTNRSGTVNPIDLLRYRQLLTGVPPATRQWLGLTANQPQP